VSEGSHFGRNPEVAFGIFKYSINFLRVQSRIGRKPDPALTLPEKLRSRKQKKKY
jgi:hypothetical protein